MRSGAPPTNDSLVSLCAGILESNFRQINVQVFACGSAGSEFVLA
jgi:hypothetical protein